MLLLVQPVFRLEQGTLSLGKTKRPTWHARVIPKLPAFNTMLACRVQQKP